MPRKSAEFDASAGRSRHDVLVSCLRELRRRALAGGRADDVKLIDAALAGAGTTGPAQPRRAVFSGLTPRQIQCLKAIAAYGSHEGLSPTLRELGETMGFNPASASRLVSRLEQKGILERDHYHHRSVRITPAGRRVLRALEQ